MNIDVQKVTTDGYWGAVWMQGSPFNVTTWNMRPTANIMMTLAYKSDSNWNETFGKVKSLIKHLFKYVVLQMRLKESKCIMIYKWIFMKMVDQLHQPT